MSEKKSKEVPGGANRRCVRALSAQTQTTPFCMAQAYSEACGWGAASAMLGTTSLMQRASGCRAVLSGPSCGWKSHFCLQVSCAPGRLGRDCRHLGLVQPLW